MQIGTRPRRVLHIGPMSDAKHSPLERRHDLTLYMRSPRAAVRGALYDRADETRRIGQRVFEARSDTAPVTGRARACRLGPNLVLVASAYAHVATSHVTYRGDGLLFLSLRLDGDFSAAGGHHGVHSRATVVYMPPGAEFDIHLPSKGPWKTLALIGTPRAFDRQWAIGRALLDALSLRTEQLAAGMPIVYRPWAVSRQALEILSSIDAPHVPASALHAYCAARGLQLVCEFIAAGPAEPHTDAADRTRARVRQARDAILANPAAAHTLDSLARAYGLNRRLLAAGFRAEFGETMFECLSEARLRLAWELLSTRHVKVAAVATQAGYADAASFTRAFRARFGITPIQIVRGDRPAREPAPAARASSR